MYDLIINIMTHTKKHTTVLIIDDDENVLDMYTYICRRVGYDVLLAKNGEKGIEIAFNKKPDIILLDVQLPHMTGLEVIKRIRADIWGKKVPIIMLTNMEADTPEAIKTIVEYKPTYYLIKSDWLPSEIMEKMQEMLT